MEYIRMNLDDEGSALKLSQPVACPLTILYSLTWKDSCFCVVTIAAQSLDGGGEALNHVRFRTVMYLTWCMGWG